MFKKYFLLPLLLVQVHIASAQNFKEDLWKYFRGGDSVATEKVLNEWTKAKPQDPDLFIAWFNFYAKQSMKEMITISKNKTGNEGFTVSDTATGERVGYLNFSAKYNSEILQKGFDQVDRGIALYPARLDMRFGKIYMLGEAENYKEFTNEIIKALEYGKQIKCAWLWADNKPVEDPEKFMLSSMQDYVTTIYNTNDDALLPLMRQISEAVLKDYPTHVESLSNIAITWLVVGDFDKALPYLLKAEPINPKDIIVLNNIAEAYRRKGDTANAKVYYQKIIKYGSKEDIEYAKEKMKEL